MLLPARVKYRKLHRGRRTGVATQGNDLAFGEFGLQASEAAWMTNRGKNCCGYRPSVMSSCASARVRLAVLRAARLLASRR